MGLLGTLRETFTPGGTFKYRCHNCGREFAYGVAFTDPNCPYCDSTDIEVIDEE